MANWVTDSLWDIAKGLGSWLGMDGAVDKIQTYLESGKNYDQVTAAMRGRRAALNSMLSELSELLDISQDEINRLMTEKPFQQSPVIQKAIRDHDARIRQMEKIERAISTKADEIQRDADQASSDLLDPKNRHKSETYKNAVSGNTTSHLIDVNEIEKGVRQYVHK